MGLHFSPGLGSLRSEYVPFKAHGEDSVLGKALSHDVIKGFEQCAIGNLLSTGLPFLDRVSPIDATEFQLRRDRLAEALVAENVDAFVVEPGYTFKYYGNISQLDWEVWEVR